MDNEYDPLKLLALLGAAQRLSLLECGWRLPHDLQVHPLQHVPCPQETVFNSELEAGLVEGRPQEVQLGVVHSGEEVVQYVVAKGGCHEKQVGGLLDIADGVNLVDAPVSGAWVLVVPSVVHKRMVVGGYLRCERQPVEAHALQFNPSYSIWNKVQK